MIRRLNTTFFCVVILSRDKITELKIENMLPEGKTLRFMMKLEFKVLYSCDCTSYISE